MSLLRLRFTDEVEDTGYQLPQVIYVSGMLWHRWERDVVDVRPLTLTALVKGLGGNLVRMSYWRFMVLLRILGLLNTPELGRLSWRHLNITPWRHWMPGRLWPARLYRYTRRRFASTVR